MSDTYHNIISFLGFTVKSPDNTLSCVGCGINLSEFNNPLIHRVGCRWIRAVFLLITQGETSETNEFLFR